VRRTADKRKKKEWASKGGGGGGRGKAADRAVGPQNISLNWTLEYAETA